MANIQYSILPYKLLKVFVTIIVNITVCDNQCQTIFNVIYK